MKTKIMKRAHELAKTMVGDYAARLSLALRLAWKEVKTPKMDPFRMKKIREVEARLDRIAEKYERFGNPEKAQLYRSYKVKLVNANLSQLLHLETSGKRSFDQLIETI